ncbi:MAG: substrate-binding domain-containing protein [Verrucomicrobiaceae bacterium]|jgi:DNA-binding LacI/PurR family transcriptional regulator|nr:substrate-binding domain-containing protein [Verrucomicrobiaceae bacterium]
MKNLPPSSPRLPQRHSLVTETIESLREGIEKGHWQGFLPGERELCESLQVSRRTLRAALAELQGQGWIEVSGRQRRRITKASGPVRKSRGPKVIGVLTSASFLTMPPPVAYVMDTLRSRLTAAGYEVRIHVQPACYSSSPARALEKFFAEHPATAWLVLSAQVPMQRWLAERRLPCFLMGSSAPGIALPSLDTDFHAACHHAGSLLWRKGHRRIALVLPKGMYGGDIASEEGLCDALRNLPGVQLRVLRHDTTTAHLCALLDQVIRGPEAPTAYLVARAAHVVTVMMHLMRRGKRIPQDVAVLSRDNDPVLDATSPLVGRYGVQAKQLASRIVLAIRQLAEGGLSSTGSVRLMPAYIAGESV